MNGESNGHRPRTPEHAGIKILPFRRGSMIGAVASARAVGPPPGSTSSPASRRIQLSLDFRHVRKLLPEKLRFPRVCVCVCSSFLWLPSITSPTWLEILVLCSSPVNLVVRWMFLPSYCSGSSVYSTATTKWCVTSGKFERVGEFKFINYLMDRWLASRPTLSCVWMCVAERKFIAKWKSATAGKIANHTPVKFVKIFVIRCLLQSVVIEELWYVRATVI